MVINCIPYLLFILGKREDSDGHSEQRSTDGLCLFRSKPLWLPPWKGFGRNTIYSWIASFSGSGNQSCKFKIKGIFIMSFFFFFFVVLRIEARVSIMARQVLPLSYIHSSGTFYEVTPLKGKTVEINSFHLSNIINSTYLSWSKSLLLLLRLTSLLWQSYLGLFNIGFTSISHLVGLLPFFLI